MSKHTIWEEAHRPRSINDMVFANQATKNAIVGIVKSGTLPNLMLVGHHGTGKTTLSKAICNDMKVHPEDVLTVFCSDEKIDALRSKVKSFAYTMAVGDYRVVRLEEMDMLSLEAQGLLRSLIEEVSTNCRFIATANYISKIIPALQSRFTVYTFSSLSYDDCLMKAADILEAEHVQYDAEALDRVVRAAIPDMRKIIQTLQRNSKDGVFAIVEQENLSDWKLALLPLLKAGNYIAARQLVCSSVPKDDLVEIYKFVVSNIDVIFLESQKADMALVITAKYQYQHAFVADPEIQIYALLIEMSMVLNG